MVHVHPSDKCGCFRARRPRLRRGDRSQQGPWSSADLEATLFLDQVLPEAPDIVVQIAHFAGAGNYVEPGVDDALGVFAAAIAGGDPHTGNLYFDVSTIVRPGASAELLALIAGRIRQIGPGRVLYGSDGAVPRNSPREAWARFVTLPLTPAELRTISENVAPYLR